MKNLIKLYDIELKKSFNDTLQSIKLIDTAVAKNLPWYLNNMLPAGKQKYIFPSIAELKSYLIKRLELRQIKKRDQFIQKITFSENMQPIENLTINVNWCKSVTWGANPTAETFIYGLGRVSSGSVSGCGYDKQSTAVANLLNQVPQFLQLLYIEKNKKYKLSNRVLFGYGAGSGILPAFAGGVGVNCYDKIFNKIGYKFETISSGKMFDVYRITKITAREAKKRALKFGYNYKD